METKERSFAERMREDGWKNTYNEPPTEKGVYQIYTRNGKLSKAEYIGNHTWKYAGGWDFCWWRHL